MEAPKERLDLVVPEQLGDVVATTKVKFGKTAMVVPVTMPAVPGRYRLSIWLHDAKGVAYDAATQALVPPLIVRVTGDFDGAIQAAPKAELTAGAETDLELRVVNLGRTAWGHEAMQAPWDENETVRPQFAARTGRWIPPQAAVVTGRWVPLSPETLLPVDAADQVVRSELPIGLKPGKSADATLSLKAPTKAGQYLLVLDVVDPDRGSLVASGADPTVVRVTVVEAPAD